MLCSQYGSRQEWTWVDENIDYGQSPANKPWSGLHKSGSEWTWSDGTPAASGYVQGGVDGSHTYLNFQFSTVRPQVLRLSTANQYRCYAKEQ
jgi:hypothetical protein